MIQVVKEAIKPDMVDISDLNPGDAFELGGKYCAKMSNNTFNKQYPIVRLDTFERLSLPGDTIIKRVSIQILVTEEEGE